MAHFRPMLAEHDVTEQQWRVLRVLSEQSPLGATEVAERASILGPSLTRIIKTLESRAMIKRETGAADARRVDLSITPAGMDLIFSLQPERRRIYEAIERRHGDEVLEPLLDLLEALITREEENAKEI